MKLCGRQRDVIGSCKRGLGFWIKKISFNWTRKCPRKWTEVEQNNKRMRIGILRYSEKSARTMKRPLKHSTWFIRRRLTFQNRYLLPEARRWIIVGDEEPPIVAKGADEMTKNDDQNNCSCVSWNKRTNKKFTLTKLNSERLNWLELRLETLSVKHILKLDDPVWGGGFSAYIVFLHPILGIFMSILPLLRRYETNSEWNKRLGREKGFFQ